MTLTFAALTASKVFGVVDIKVWYLLTAAAVWFVAWLVRRYAPDVWARAVGKNPGLAQIWLAVLGALMSAAPALGRPIWDVVQQTVVGAILATVGANGLHAILKASPLPYNGAEKRVEEAYVRRNTPPGGLSPVGPSPTPPPKV